MSLSKIILIIFLIASGVALYQAGKRNGEILAMGGTIGIEYEQGYEDGYKDGKMLLPISATDTLIGVWNQVLDDKKANCLQDKDCEIIDNKPYIQFEMEGNFKDNFHMVMGEFLENYEIKIKKIK